MGRKKPRVAAEEELTQSGQETYPPTTTPLFPPSIPASFPPIVPNPVSTGTNAATRIAPHDPRRRLLLATTTPTVANQGLLIKEEVYEYCQPASLSSTANMQMPNALMKFSSPPPFPPNILPPSTFMTSPTVLNNIQPMFPLTQVASLSSSTPITAAVVKPMINTGELIEEDVYLSDGSNEEDNVKEQQQEEDEDAFFSCDEMDQSDDDEDHEPQSKKSEKKKSSSTTTAQQIKVSLKKTDALEIILTTSKMGLIRKGSMHKQLLLQAQQQNLQSKQWIRGKNPNPREAHPVVTEGEDEEEDTNDNTKTSRHHDSAGHVNEEEEDEEESEEKRLANLDPATRAAHLLAEKQRKLYEAKITARILESSENAGRDPCLFSKRTAFDIRMDQIEEKPWLRMGGDLTDYFNYGLTEEDWMEYSQTQLEVRQELTDASRQKRTPDPTIIPVLPRAPRKQQPRVAVATKKDSKNEEDDDMLLDGPVVGPTLPNSNGDNMTTAWIKNEMDIAPTVITDSVAPVVEKAPVTQFVDIGGGAWGAGAVPGSVLAKLIEDQDKVSSGKPPPTIHMMPPPPHIPHLPPPPTTTTLPLKVDIPMDPRRVPPPQPESTDYQGDSFMSGVPEDKNPSHRDPSNRPPRGGPGRWGEYDDFPGPMHNDMGHLGAMPYQRQDEWRGEGRNNFNPGPPNPRFPPHNQYRGGPPSAYPPQFPPNHGPPPYHDPSFVPGPGMNSPPGIPQEYRGPPRRMGPSWGQQSPPPHYPHQDGFEPDNNWKRPREEFNPLPPYGGPNAGGRFPPQGFGGNNFRR